MKLTARYFQFFVIILFSLFLNACDKKSNGSAAHKLVNKVAAANNKSTGEVDDRTDPSTIDIYAKTHAGMISSTAQSALSLVYVPNSLDGTVSVIDPATYQVIATFKTGKNPQHVVPAYDLKTLWVLNNLGNSITPIDPNTGKAGNNIDVEDPYNLYYTPNGRYAMVVAEKLKRLDFLDPATMRIQRSIPIKCSGINHVDFTVDGRYAIATCEFSGKLVKIDLQNFAVVDYLNLVIGNEKSGMPQDIRSSPNGQVFFVADMRNNGVYVIDPKKFAVIGFIATGVGTHSIYPSRDGRYMYVANRGCSSSTFCLPHGQGSISVIDPYNFKIVTNWLIPGGGSPDMGNVSADGNELWLSGRYDREVYVFNTITGELIHRIAVGRGPHGLTVWPQPGQYSLGHTGNMR